MLQSETHSHDGRRGTPWAELQVLPSGGSIVSGSWHTRGQSLHDHLAEDRNSGELCNPWSL